ncbi:hypothetical protein HN709_05155 [Candidatus Peregrinibacteria bacterium]|nr:hypothetical protein [Candidatus Peregrinibacteria bacterium]
MSKKPRKSPRKGPHGGAPDPDRKSFDRYWAKGMEASCLDYARTHGMLVNNRILRDGVENTMRLMAQKKRIQFQIMRTLKGGLGGEKELIDLMSGEAYSTMPLLLRGHLDRLVLFEDGSSSVIHRALIDLIKVFSLDGKVELNDATIGGEGRDLEIPGIENVVFGETGLSLPPELRQERPKMPGTNPSSYRSSHVFDAVPDFGDVLSCLEGVRRTLHVFDTPEHSREERQGGDRSRGYVESFVEQAPGWAVDAWGPIMGKDSNPTTYGVLKHRP